MKYSALSLPRHAVTGNRSWKPVWRYPASKPAYDTVIVGGGGHGLTAAHNLAKLHGITDVAVAAKGLLGSGNVGRNTTISRSNDLLPGNMPFCEHSLNLWEGLEQDINDNAMRLAGVDAEFLDAAAVHAMAPTLNMDGVRFPMKGGLLWRRDGDDRGGRADVDPARGGGLPDNLPPLLRSGARRGADRRWARAWPCHASARSRRFAGSRRTVTQPPATGKTRLCQ